jgi:hypothetical protein
MDNKINELEHRINNLKTIEMLGSSPTLSLRDTKVVLECRKERMVLEAQLKNLKDLGSTRLYI